MDRVSLRNVDLGDRSGMGTGQIGHGLFGFQLHYGLIGFDRIVFGDVNLGHLGAVDAFAQFGYFEFRAHAGCLPRFSVDIPRASHAVGVAVKR